MIKKLILLIILVGYVGATQPIMPSWIMAGQHKIEKINLVVMEGLSAIKETLYKLWAKTRFCKKKPAIIAPVPSVIKPNNYLSKLAATAKFTKTFLQQHPVACALTVLTVGGCAFGYKKYLSLRNERNNLQQETCIPEQPNVLNQENAALIEALNRNTALFDRAAESFLG